MKLAGFAVGLEKYLKRLQLQLPENAKVLDIACGPGMLGLAIKKLFPTSSVLETDREKKFYEHYLKNLRDHKFSEDEFSFGLSDLNSPEKVFLVNEDREVQLEPNSFDLVIIGAALSYAADPVQTTLRLANLLRPEGYFINLEMSQSLFSKSIYTFFDYPRPDVPQLVKALSDHGFAAQAIPFTSNELPVNLTRIGIVAQRI